MSINNPFLTGAQRATIINSINNNPFSDLNQGVVASQDYFYLGRANTDLDPAGDQHRPKSIRFVAGLDGDFNGLSGNEWNWELVGNYGRAAARGPRTGAGPAEFRQCRRRGDGRATPTAAVPGGAAERADSRRSTGPARRSTCSGRAC